MSKAKRKMSPEMDALKAKLKVTWMTGDFGEIARAYAPGASSFVDRLELKPGEKILDVACGTGNTSIPAARAGAAVTGVDIAPNLLEQARRQAKAQGLEATFEEGDAESLSYPPGSFDTVLTMFGAMFAPRPDKVAAELKRVCRSGGRIVMANWTPSGFIGQMFKLTASYVPPPPLMASPVLWGDEDTLNERFKTGITSLKLNRRMITFEFPFPPAEVVEHFRTYYGPTQKAFDTLDDEKRGALRRDLTNHWGTANQADDGTTRVESEYMEVVAIRE